MKIKVKIRRLRAYDGFKVDLPMAYGDWFDLQAYEDTIMMKNGSYMVSLGVAMELPEGFEALVVPRSSLFSKYGVLLVNSVGVIDNKYHGNSDVWKAPLLCIGDNVELKRGTRVCQFKIVLSQHATVWQKLRWLFCSGVEFEDVDVLTGENRRGFGSTGE